MDVGSFLFVPSTKQTEWAHELFPGYSPAELPVAGRRIIDYGVEHAHNLGAPLLEVLDWHWSERLAASFANPETTGYALFYEKGEGPVPRGLNDLEGVQSPLTGNISDGLMVVWGLCLSTHIPPQTRLSPVPPEECAETPMGLYRREGGRWMRVKPGGVTMRRIKSWHWTNIVVMRDPGSFTLPCYSAERGVYLGRNAVIEHGADIKPPVLLSSNTWLARNVCLDGGVVVGSGSFIGEGSRLKRTVIAEDTYIGPGLDVENKIVVGRRVIDAETGAWVDMEDDGVSRRIGRGTFLGFVRSVWHFLRGKSMGRRG